MFSKLFDLYLLITNGKKFYLTNNNFYNNKHNDIVITVISFMLFLK